jgi:hypothetical protein
VGLSFVRGTLRWSIVLIVCVCVCVLSKSHALTTNLVLTIARVYTHHLRIKRGIVNGLWSAGGFRSLVNVAFDRCRLGDTVWNTTRDEQPQTG